MPYRLNCQHCGVEMEFMSLRIGDTGRCKNCKENISITDDAKYFGGNTKEKLVDKTWFTTLIAVIVVIILVLLHALLH